MANRKNNSVRRRADKKRQREARAHALRNRAFAELLAKSNAHLGTPVAFGDRPTEPEAGS